MEPIIVRQLFDSPIEKVWNALSAEAELKKWYFLVQDYVFEVGKTFTFYESEESHNYFHRCQFLEIVPQKLIVYSWEHPSHSKGKSIVKWETELEGEKTSVTLTHTGVENFADAGEEFAVSNFKAGWNAIVKTTLRNYLYGIEKLVFDIEIKATPEILWQKLWEKDNYTNWTEPFCAGSYITGELIQGGRVHFLSPSGEGMYSDVAFLKENELMVFSHIGMIKDKEELPIDSETAKWTGCFESYKLTRTGNLTKLKVEVDAIEDYAEYMKTTFPLALQKLKETAENG